MSLRCSVVIVNWETTEFLQRLLDSLRANPASGGMEVIVVDNASSDFDIEQMAASHPDVGFLPQQTNTGFAKGNNIGIAQAKGEYVVLLNPDTEVRPGSLDMLLEFLETHPDASLAAPKLLWPDGRIQKSCRGFPWPGSVLFAASGLSRVFPSNRVIGAYFMDWFDHNETRKVDQPMASCWAIPRSALDSVGPFDEQFPIFFNDVDWAFRARLKGYDAWFVSSAEVLHHHGQGTAKAGKAVYRHSHIGLSRFYDKWMPGRSPWIALVAARGVSYLYYRLRTIGPAKNR